MNEPSFGRPWWTRRRFLQGSAAVIAGVYGLLGRFGLAAEIPNQYRRLEISACGTRAQSPNPAACCAWAFLTRPPHFDIHQSGTIVDARRAWPACSTI